MEKPTAAPALCPRNSRRLRGVPGLAGMLLRNALFEVCVLFILHLGQRGEYHSEGSSGRWTASFALIAIHCHLFPQWIPKGPFARPRIGVICGSTVRRRCL